MTSEEFRTAAFVLSGGWPGEFTANDEDAYYFLLSEIEIGQIMGALKALRGSKFRPSASEIAAVLNVAAATIPTFDELLVLLERALYVHVSGWFADESERDAAVSAERRRRLEAMPPLAAHFIDRHGQRFHGEGFNGEDGKWRRKELREAWAAHCEAMEGRELTALALRTGKAGMRQLDPLAALALGTGDGSA